MSGGTQSGVAGLLGRLVGAGTQPEVPSSVLVTAESLQRALGPEHGGYYAIAGPVAMLGVFVAVAQLAISLSEGASTRSCWALCMRGTTGQAHGCLHEA